MRAVCVVGLLLDQTGRPGSHPIDRQLPGLCPHSSRSKIVTQCLIYFVHMNTVYKRRRFHQSAGPTTLPKAQQHEMHRSGRGRFHPDCAVVSTTWKKFIQRSRIAARAGNCRLCMCLAPHPRLHPYIHRNVRRAAADLCNSSGLATVRRALAPPVETTHRAGLPAWAKTPGRGQRVINGSQLKAWRRWLRQP